MGQFFHIVNPQKKQYISASTFEENSKASGVFAGLHGYAVALLVCKSNEVGRVKNSLAGMWFGDEIYVVGDDYGKPNAYGIETSTPEKLWRNLYSLADEEYEDISLKVIALMCEWNEGWCEEFVQRAVDGWHHMLICLGNVVFTVGCEPLEQKLDEQIGKDWKEKYKKEWLNYGISPVTGTNQWNQSPEWVKDWLKEKKKI